MHNLTGKKEWKWENAQQESFDKLKEALTSTPVLRMPTDEGKYRVEADSSDFATGAVLSQEQEGKWWPIAYMSKSLNSVERNYDIYDKELLAIVRALDEWSQYLRGTPQRFEILTDHKNLQYFQTQCKLNRRQARWPYSSLNLTFPYSIGQEKAQENQMHCPGEWTMMMGAMTMKGSHF